MSHIARLLTNNGQTIVLKELHIHNYALFEDVHVQLGPHFNVFSGETGAGKSLLVGAIGLLLGNKGDSMVVRSGCSKAEVIGVLGLAAENREARAWLQNIHLDVEDTDELSVRRVLQSNGKSSCYIQHSPVSRSKLEEFMTLLFDLHSQHQNQSLFHSGQQLRMLDDYAHLNQKLEEFSRTFQEIKHKKKLLAETRISAAQQGEEAAYLQDAIAEIGSLQPQEDEDVILSERIEVLSNAESIYSELEQFAAHGSQAVDLLNKGESQLSWLGKQLRPLEELLSRLQSVIIEVEDIIDGCKVEKNQLRMNPGQLKELDERLSKLIMLSRKYGNSSLNQTLKFAGEAEKKLANWENNDENLAEQEREILHAEKGLMQEAQYLSQQRKKYAAELEQGIKANLRNLGMVQARFQIELSHRKNAEGQVLCHSYGIDKIRFLLAANPGEDFHEIQQVASGGEISRIMLAIKSESLAALSASDAGGGHQNMAESGIETIIFDEIDTGIGGETGIRLAEHIYQLGQRRQVFCVTHLASIAASANTHIKIEKQSDDKSTKVSIFSLTAEERTAELARMLSGDAKNPASLAHAEELLGRYW